jgi:hypothetical protein
VDVICAICSAFIPAVLDGAEFAVVKAVVSSAAVAKVSMPVARMGSSPSRDAKSFARRNGRGISTGD